jgi:hypothetical protein
MSLLFALLAIAAPSAADVQRAEEARALEPLIDWNATVDGTGFIEFAPTIETRKAVCAVTQTSAFQCSYEARNKDGLASEFGAWDARRELLEWRDKCNCWVIVSASR